MNTNSLKNVIRLAALASFSLLPGMACSYSATSATVGAGGGYVQINIYTQPGCMWQVGNSSFVSVVSNRQGYGNSAVKVYVAPNRGAVRTATLNGLAYVPPTIGTRSGGPGGWVTLFRSYITEY